jgi:NADH pyrophosphatase NudC (nudix superfamily)
VEPHPRLPVAVSCFIVDAEERFLLFSRDRRSWRVMGGQLEEGETVGECIAREIREELGDVSYRFLDVLDAHVFDYPGLGSILSVFCLLEYRSGELVLASDMARYEHRWFTSQELDAIEVAVPFQPELVDKARHFARHYRERAAIPFFKFRWASPA